MGIKVSEFGKTSKGKIAHIYTLVNGKGMALEGGTGGRCEGVGGAKPWGTIMTDGKG